MKPSKGNIPECNHSDLLHDHCTLRELDREHEERKLKIQEDAEIEKELARIDFKAKIAGYKHVERMKKMELAERICNSNNIVAMMQVLKDLNIDEAEEEEFVDAEIEFDRNRIQLHAC